MPLFNDPVSIKAVATHPGFASGKYYASVSFSSYTNASLTAGYIYYSYFFVPFAQNFNRVAFQSSTTYSTTESVRVAVYQVTNGLPSTLVADLGTTSFTSSGIKEVSCSLSLSPGWYAIAIVFNPNNLTAPCASLVNSLIGQASANTNYFSGYRDLYNYSTPFPNIASFTTNLIEFYAPIIWLKAV